MGKKKKARRGPNGQRLPRLQPGMGALMRRAGQRDAASIQINPAGHEKMSEVLVRFAEPIMPLEADLETTRGVLMFASSVWNSCLMPDGAAALREAVAATEGAEIIKHDYELLAARKAELFPENRRFIVDVEVADGGNEFHVNVASSLVPERLAARTR